MQADGIYNSGMKFLSLWKHLCKESIRRGGFVDGKIDPSSINSSSLHGLPQVDDRDLNLYHRLCQLEECFCLLRRRAT